MGTHLAFDDAPCGMGGVPISRSGSDGFWPGRPRRAGRGETKLLVFKTAHTRTSVQMCGTGRHRSRLQSTTLGNHGGGGGGPVCLVSIVPSLPLKSLGLNSGLAIDVPAPDGIDCLAIPHSSSFISVALTPDVILFVVCFILQITAGVPCLRVPTNNLHVCALLLKLGTYELSGLRAVTMPDEYKRGRGGKCKLFVAMAKCLLACVRCEFTGCRILPHRPRLLLLDPDQR